MKKKNPPPYEGDQYYVNLLNSLPRIRAELETILKRLKRMPLSERNALITRLKTKLNKRTR